MSISPSIYSIPNNAPLLTFSTDRGCLRGEQLEGSPNLLAFTGKERDEETGYTYHGARYFDAALLTSWMAVDPMSDKYPSLSPYNYCAWNPIKLVDEDGRDIWNINDNGELIWQESSETDKIIAKDGTFVDVATGILTRSTDGEPGKDYRMNDLHYSLSFGENKNNAYEVFEFLADHSQVEFSLVETSAFETSFFSVTTSFETESDSWGCDMSNKANANGMLRRHTHSHPSGALAHSDNDLYSFIGNTSVSAYVYCPKGRNLSPQYKNGGYKRYHSSSEDKNNNEFSQSKMTINGNQKIYKMSR